MKVHELFESTGPAGWIQGAMSRGAEGQLSPAVAERTCKWCLLGAIIKCYGYYTAEYEMAIVAIKNEIGVWPPKFNDQPYTTFEQVLELAKKLDI